jgi:FKBP-type peptidyl-prolyl cis-trans isomerase
MGQGPDRRLIILGVFALLAVGIVGAILISRSGGGEDSSTSTAPEASAKTKPKVVVPKGAPPKQLVENDLIEGTGDEAKSGDEVTVQYVGVGYETRKQFDASWDRKEPFSFTLGGGEVIPGWDQGVEGMKVGGRRELIIPPDLGYGKAGSPPVIGENETLVFVIDLLAVK